MSIELLHGDCLGLLPQVADGSVDMVFADLPYGVTANKWDTPIDLAALWAQLLRVGKRNAAFVFTATFKFACALERSKPEYCRYDIIWERSRPSGFLNAKRAPLRSHEIVLVFYRSSPTYNAQKTQRVGKSQSSRLKGAGTSENYLQATAVKPWVDDGHRLPRSVLRIASERCDTLQHPTQKPVALLEWLVRTYTNPGDTVLDPTMGSGTTGVSCINTDRKFIGIEKDATYYAVAQNRMEAAHEGKTRQHMDGNRPERTRPDSERATHRSGHQLTLAPCDGPAVAVPAT